MNYRRLFIPNSIVFITVVTFDRKEFLIPNIELLKKAIKQTIEKYQFNIVAICVLKNHIHMLLKTNNIKDYPDIIKNIKRNFRLILIFHKYQIITNQIAEKVKVKKVFGNEDILNTQLLMKMI